MITFSDTALEALEAFRGKRTDAIIRIDRIADG